MIFIILDFYSPKIKNFYMLAKNFTSELDKSLKEMKLKINAQIAKNMVHRLIHV